MKIIRAVALLIVVACSVRGQDQQPAVLSIEQLRALAAERPLQVGSLRVAYEVFQDPSAENRHGHIPYLFRNILVDTATGRYAMDRSLEIEGVGMEGEFKTASFAFDGEAQEVLLPDDLIGIIMKNALADGLAESQLWSVMMLGESQPDGLGIDDSSLDSLLSRGVVRDRIEMAADRPCHVVDAYRFSTLYATVWLDAERDLLPLRRVVYNVHGSVASEIAVDSVAFHEQSGTWIPKSWHTEIHVRGEILRTYTHVDVESVEFNPPISEENFKLQFPPGTLVTDQIAGQGYVISDSGGIGEILFERVNGEWVALTPPDAAPQTDGQVAPAPAPLFDSLAELARYAARESQSRRTERTQADAATDEPTPERKKVELAELRQPREPTQPAIPTIPTVSDQPASGSQRLWFFFALGIIALLSVGCLAWRGCSNARQRGLLIASLLVVAFVGWRVAIAAWYIPPTVVVFNPIDSGRVPELGAPATEETYALADGELIRWIPSPVPAEREELLKRLGLRPVSDIKAVTVVWDGTPRFNGMMVGTPQFPRTLFQALEHSLKVPLHRLDGVDVARKIAMPGDWIIRAGADLDECMSYVEKVVRLSGHENFRVAREMRKRPGFIMSGTARAPDKPIRMLPPPRDTPPASPYKGILRNFAVALSAAIQMPISNLAELDDLKISWEDNARSYIDLDIPVSDDMVSALLSEISDALGVTFTSTEIEELAWRLENAK